MLAGFCPWQGLFTEVADGNFRCEGAPTYRKSHKGMGLDAGVWLQFLEGFNGRVFFGGVVRPVSNKELDLFTVAAGSTGLGECFRGKRCVESWPPGWEKRGASG